MPTPPLKRSFFQRLFGICATRPPADEGCWSYSEGKIVIDLNRAPELSVRGGSIRLEKKDGLPERILVVLSEAGEFQVFRNRCTHMGRRLDPIPGTEMVQCCSLGKSIFDARGESQSGLAVHALVTYKAVKEDGKLIIML